MTRLEYIKKRTEISQQIIALKKELECLETTYRLFIESDTKFSEGEKVRIKGRNGTFRTAFISKIDINEDGTVDIQLLKTLKDGTPSKRKDFYMNLNDIKKIPLPVFSVGEEIINKKSRIKGKIVKVNDTEYILRQRTKLIALQFEEQEEWQPLNT